MTDDNSSATTKFLGAMVPWHLGYVNLWTLMIVDLMLILKDGCWIQNGHGGTRSKTVKDMHGWFIHDYIFPALYNNLSLVSSGFSATFRLNLHVHCASKYLLEENKQCEKAGFPVPLSSNARIYLLFKAS